ncbi:MAG: hypothetical protein IKZ96_03185 [Bacilli bacterium]|nr:hypothetical protein [Bacilli bacterium]
MINVKKEINEVLTILSNLNEEIPFKYNSRTRKIVADITTKRETFNIDDLIVPEDGPFAFNKTFRGKMDVVISTNNGSEKIAEISVDKCNLSEAKRKFYSEYRDYCTGDTYQEPIVDKLLKAVTPSNNGASRIKYSLNEDSLKNMLATEDTNGSVTKDQQMSLENFNIQLAKDREKQAIEADTTEKKDSKELTKEQKEALESFSLQLSKKNTDTEEEKPVEIETVPGTVSNNSGNSDIRFDNKAGIFVPVKTKKTWADRISAVLEKSGFRKVEDNSNYYWGSFDLEDKTTESTNTVSTDSKDSAFGESSENITGTIGPAYGAVNSRNNTISEINQSKEEKVSLKEAAKQYFGYLFARSDKFGKVEKLNGTLTLKEKTSKLFESTKEKLSYIFARSEKVNNGYTIIGPGPKKIVKRPLRVKLKDSLENAKDGVKEFFGYTFSKSEKVNNGYTIIGPGPRKIVKRPLRVKLKDSLENAKDGIKDFFGYTFSKSEKVDVKPVITKKGTSTLNNGTNNPTGTGLNNGGTPIVKPEPAKPVVNEAEELVKKQYTLLEKQYQLEDLKLRNKLGTYERMFVEDAKAECLDIKDNEFRQMINERCVDKLAIFTYYCDLIDLKRQMASKYINEFKDYFNTLGEYEKMFVEDAIAEYIYPGDSEYMQMLSERCVNKDSVTRFLKQYKKLAVLYKEISDRQRELTDVAKVFGFHREFKELDINTLRKLTKPRKSELTEEELKKYNASKLKKDELVEILDRTDTEKVKKLVKGDNKKDVK